MPPKVMGLTSKHCSFAVKAYGMVINTNGWARHTKNDLDDCESGRVDVLSSAACVEGKSNHPRIHFIKMQT